MGKTIYIYIYRLRERERIYSLYTDKYIHLFHSLDTELIAYVEQYLKKRVDISITVSLCYIPEINTL